ncbi:hypothetical protein EMGBS15_00780 [Filimonas sp.]|nr:hypothetical protein EMGBS15_00780 [Filimonas sp.]
MRKFLKYSLLLVNIFFALLLASTRLVTFTNPYEYNFLGLLGLFTPVLVLINVVFIFIWLFSRKFLYTLLPVSVIWFSWNVFSVCFATKYNTVQDFTKSKEYFTVMSYNVRLLDLYHWNQDKNTRKKIIRFFKEKNPTVLCLQEFYTNNDSVGVNNIRAIKYSCHYEYVAECNMHVTKRGKWGSIIFSHLPIVRTKNYEIDVQGNNLLQKADIAFQQDTFSVFNVHLKSNRFSKNEANLVNKDQLPNLSDSTLEQSKSIFLKLQDNAVNRGLEADIISSIIAQNEKPVLLCGDLNDIPSSYVYFKIKDTMKDAFLEKGFGLGKTYRNTIPVLRIDYIFHDEKINLLGFEKLDVPYSDHEPLMANFTFKQDAASIQH